MAMTMIPEDVAGLLEQALREAITTVASEINEHGGQPISPAWLEEVARFEWLRSAHRQLEASAGEAHIDLDFHRTAIVEALSQALECERDLMADDSEQRGEQYRGAHARALTIEGWVRTTGLTLRALRVRDTH